MSRMCPSPLHSDFHFFSGMSSPADSQQDVSEFQHKLLEWLEDAFKSQETPCHKPQHQQTPNKSQPQDSQPCSQQEKQSDQKQTENKV